MTPDLPRVRCPECGARAASAFRAAAEAAPTAAARARAIPAQLAAVGISEAWTQLADMAEATANDHPTEWRSAVAALLRGLAPDPDGELAEAERALRRTLTGPGRPAMWWQRALPILLAEYDRRGAVDQMMARHADRLAHQIDKGLAELVERQDAELAELRAEVERRRVELERIHAAYGQRGDELKQARAELAELRPIRDRACEVRDGAGWTWEEQEAARHILGEAP